MIKAEFTKSLTIAMSLEHFEKIKKITDDRQISIAQWVRDALAIALTTNQEKEGPMK